MQNSDNVIYLNCESNQYVDDSIKEKIDDYTIDQCVIVRTTNIFPFNKIIETPFHARTYSFDNSSIIGKAIIEKVKKDIKFEPFNEESRQTLFNELKKYQVAFETFRTTIHFTINGLVTSHLYGNFDNRDYIIIEPLKYHINNSSLLGLNVADTYFNDDLHLSDEAVILIKEEKFNEIKNNPDYQETLAQFKIFVYRGTNEQLAIKEVLSYLGYDSFIINNHGYVNGITEGTAAQKMYNFIAVLREKYNLSGSSHFNSVENIKDSLMREQEAEKTDIEHFLYIINNTTSITQELKDKVFSLLEKDKIQNQKIDKLTELGFSNSYKERNIYIMSIASKIVEMVPLEEIERLTV